MYNDDLCYIPTRGMCEINKVLDKEFFEDDPENIIKQEIITYKKDGNRIKKITFERTYIANKHTDCHSTEIFCTGVDNGTT
mgnify:FL=1|tara:strand:- start:293 stop:535 length:243 start_codon:yes stop_codon:yes gene_type:complete